jgi:hypothetical protein
MKTQILSIAMALGALAATTQQATANNKLVERNKAVEKMYNIVTFEEKESLNKEADLTFENWMTDASYWHLDSETNSTTGEPKLEALTLEPWMSSDKAFKIAQVETKKSLENWMTDNKLWRFEK